MIYHILTRLEWEEAEKESEYWPPSTDEEDYIHCYTEEQLLNADFSEFSSNQELTIIKINSAKLESFVVVEDITESGIMYPHIYGYLNLDAVEAIQHLYLNDLNDGLKPFIKVI